MEKEVLLEEALTRSVIGASYEVYSNLGFGFLEHLHLSALERELQHRGHRVQRELPVRIMYKGGELGMQRLDMVVDDLLIVEGKSTRLLPDFASRQLYNYLSCTQFEVGLLLHFGPKPSFHRAVYENHLKCGHVASVTSVPSVQSVSSFTE
jgi:GxxExxY protein